MRNSIRWFCLEDNTERGESNPGRSLGIITKEKRAVWKTVPHCCAPSPSAQSARAQRVHEQHRCDGFYLFTDFFYLVLYIVEDFFRIVFAPIRRRVPPARGNPWQSQRPAGAEKSNNTIKIRERTNPSHQGYPWLILNMASEPKASELSSFSE